VHARRQVGQGLTVRQMKSLLLVRFVCFLFFAIAYRTDRQWYRNYLSWSQCCVSGLIESGFSISSESGFGSGTGWPIIGGKIQLKKRFIFFDQKFRFTYP
jgi:hypothetical protein